MTVPTVPTDRRPSLSARALLRGVGFYRTWISPALPPSCRYAPTCSQYAATAITRFGAARGAYLAVRRIATCHPFHRGGLDEVPDTFTLRRPRAAAPTLITAP